MNANNSIVGFLIFMGPCVHLECFSGFKILICQSSCASTSLYFYLSDSIYEHAPHMVGIITLLC
jgi:hypothetical protein